MPRNVGVLSAIRRIVLYSISALVDCFNHTVFFGGRCVVVAGKMAPTRRRPRRTSGRRSCGENGNRRHHIYTRAQCWFGHLVFVMMGIIISVDDCLYIRPNDTKTTAPSTSPINQRRAIAFGHFGRTRLLWVSSVLRDSYNIVVIIILNVVFRLTSDDSVDNK